jgi:hypothetical protein
MWVGVKFTNTKGQSIIAEPDFCSFKRDENGKYLKDEKGLLIIDKYVVKEFCEKDSEDTQKYFRTICDTEEYIPNPNYDKNKDYFDDDFEEEYIPNPEHEYNYSEQDGVGKSYNFKFEDFVDYIPLRELEKID